MKIITAFAVGLALAAALTVAPANAQNSRSFVSGHGDNANNCLLATPCRTFAVAITKTNAGGEITILDPAGYGPVTINKAFSIVNDGVGEAGMLLTAAGDGITISAGVNDSVTLRGLSIDGGGAGATGIQFNTGKSLTVANSVIRHFTGRGINFTPNATSSLAVSNTLVADNAGPGIFVTPSGSGAVTAVFNRVEANNNSTGIALNGSTSTGTVKATVIDSVAAGNGNVGFLVFTDPGSAPTTLMLFHSAAANNSTGLVAQGSGATVRAFQTMVTGNANGWQVFTSGVVQSYGNNSIDGNTNPGNELAPPPHRAEIARSAGKSRGAAAAALSLRDETAATSQADDVRFGSLAP